MYVLDSLVNYLRPQKVGRTYIFINFRCSKFQLLRRVCGQTLIGQKLQLLLHLRSLYNWIWKKIIGSDTLKWVFHRGGGHQEISYAGSNRVKPCIPWLDTNIHGWKRLVHVANHLNPFACLTYFDLLCSALTRFDLFNPIWPTFYGFDLVVSIWTLLDPVGLCWTHWDLVGTCSTLLDSVGPSSTQFDLDLAIWIWW